MKRFLIAALLATTIATPALAQRGQGDRAARQQQRAERQAQRPQAAPVVRNERGTITSGRADGRPDWAAERQNVRRGDRDIERVGVAPAQREALREARRDEARTIRQTERGEIAGGRRDDVQDFRRERRDDRQDFRTERRDDRGDFRRERIEDRGDLDNGTVTRGEFRRDRRDDRRDFERDRRGDTRDFNRDRRGDVRDYRGNDRRYYGGGNRRWDSRAWRSDRRYDWQAYRHYNSRLFRPGRYYAPYGYNYGYRRFSIGLYLDSIFFSSRYFISNPWQYRLPDPGYGYRWVRYYNDVLLIDEYSGYVVDVIHNFFY